MSNHFVSLMKPFLDCPSNQSQQLSAALEDLTEIDRRTSRFVCEAEGIAVMLLRGFLSWIGPLEAELNAWSALRQKTNQL